ncbi:MAG: tRNA (adenosine(37)-N6)-threonylcarbamoyltransferase complex dimerization subunit type 1 TsaB [Spirochaetales bacterium]|nr:tRNA (adenosine(37)-N6)-threonylcarbamoyltransferase complex dimerization subunit type 1 TsaB [Spirochaetales bacterium]
MNILAFDTANSGMQLCLKMEENYYENFRSCGMKHAQMLMTQIDSLFREAELKPNELDLVVCGIGPGSFTGMRIGLSTAKGLCSALRAHLKCVSMLDVYGIQYSAWKGSVIPVIDAKKSRFYGSVYKNGKRINEYFDLSADKLISSENIEYPVLICGPDSILLEYMANEDTIIESTGQTAMGKQLLNYGELKFGAEGPDNLKITPMYIRKSDAVIAVKK